jgi:hypothetical protein
MSTIDLSKKNLVSKDLKKHLNLSPDIKFLYLYNNNLTKVPSLKNTNIEGLALYDNDLEKLPQLPITLKRLGLFNNKITVLKKLPNTLEALSIENNPLVKITKFPKSLKNLWIDPKQIGLVLGKITNPFTQIRITN